MQQPQHHHHHHKPKPALSGTGSLSWIRRSPPPSPPHKKPWGAGAGGSRGRYACRLVPLLVLTLYSLFTVLRIPSSSLVVNTADSGEISSLAFAPELNECWSSTTPFRFVLK
jgi:hypothetical protein